MTYRKELPKLGIPNGGLSGKFGYNLGKRFGGELASLSVPKDDDDENRAAAVEKFWEGLEDAANRLIQSSSSKEMTMKRMEFSSEEEALSKFGEVIFDAGQLASRDKRIKKELKAAKEAKEKGESVVPATTSSGGGAVSVGQLSSSDGQLFSLSLLHGDNLVPLSSLGRIKILRENPKNESNIVCNKKKCEVTIKFCVVPPSSSSSDGGGDDAAVVVENGNNTELGVTLIEGSKAMSKEIRLEEGTNYELWTQQMRVEAMSTLSATTTAQEEESAASTTAEATVDNTQAKAKAAAADDMVVTAFEVAGSIDYNKLIEQFGSKELTPYLLRRLENVTVKQGTVDRLHRFLRREIFFSHRDIEKICELLEGWYGVSPPPMDGDHDVEMTTTTTAAPASKPTSPCPIYLYTGRGPSSAAMHLGHLVPFLFTAWLQKAFQCPLVIQMTDDEKFIFKGEYTSENSGDGTGANGLDPNRTGDNLDYFANLTTENAKDIIACDFIPDKTFLFSDLDYVGRMYPNIVRIWKAVTVNQVNGVFGFDSSANIGKTAFPAIQAAPSFGSSFPNVLGGGNGGSDVANPATLACLIPCAIDQDPYFRLTRDIAHKLVPSHHPLQGKPSLIHSKFFPPLQGAQGKMSSSDANSAIFLTDTFEDIERKIKQHAFSGGQDTKKKQEELGANLDVDVSYQWLRFFLEDDDELIRIGKEYGSGSGEHWSTGKVKAKLVAVLKDLVEEHQERRNAVTDEVVKQWMTERCIL